MSTLSSLSEIIVICTQYHSTIERKYHRGTIFLIRLKTQKKLSLPILAKAPLKLAVCWPVLFADWPKMNGGICGLCEAGAPSIRPSSPGQVLSVRPGKAKIHLAGVIIRVVTRSTCLFGGSHWSSAIYGHSSSTQEEVVNM